MKKGYSLMELVLVLALLSIVAGVAIPNVMAYQHRMWLTTTAKELESAILLAKQLSIDEDREYVVELGNHRFSVRQNYANATRVISTTYPAGVTPASTSQRQLVITRGGLTSYVKFILENRRHQRIDVVIHIGTGRVERSALY